MKLTTNWDDTIIREREIEYNKCRKKTFTKMCQNHHQNECKKKIKRVIYQVL